MNPLAWENNTLGILQHPQLAKKMDGVTPMLTEVAELVKLGKDHDGANVYILPDRMFKKACL